MVDRIRVNVASSFKETKYLIGNDNNRINNNNNNNNNNTSYRTHDSFYIIVHFCPNEIFYR